jgi:hypothetical protein
MKFVFITRFIGKFSEPVKHVDEEIKLNAYLRGFERY